MAAPTYDYLVPYEPTSLEQRALRDKFKLRLMEDDVVDMLIKTDMALDDDYIRIPHKVGYFNKAQLNTAIATSTNTDVNVVLKVSAIYPVQVKKGSVLKNRDEIFVVYDDPTVTSSTITCPCHRGTNASPYSTTAVATHIENDWVEILPEILDDVTEFDKSDHQLGEHQVAYTQFLRLFELEMADNARAQEAISTTGDLSQSRQLDDGMRWAKQKIRKLIFRGTHAAGTPSNATSGKSNKRSARGIVDACVNLNGINNSASSADLTTDMIDSDIEEYLDRGGDAERLIMFVSGQKKYINTFLGSRVRVDQSVSTLKNYVTTYESERKVDIIRVSDELVPDNEYLIIDPALHGHFHFLKGRGIQKQKLAKTGSSEKDWIVADGGVVSVNPELIIRRHTLNTP